jgi:hypothetical protein
MRLCSIDYLALAGSALMKRKNSGSAMLGYLIFLLTGILIGLLYAVTLSVWGAPSWWRGLILSVPHISISMAATLILCRDCKVRQKLFPSPSPHHHHPAYSIIIIIMLHNIFGATMGIFYNV